MKRNKKARMDICPCCDGLGEYMDSKKIRRDSPEPPYSTCPYCGGSGEVTEAEWSNYDNSRSVSEYEQDNKEYADECRYEERRDIERFGY
jgi:DnaJ-class molecular chaperone